MGLRRPSRQIEVFDISLMAVVTKAMGAFLVLFVLVLPYYTSDPDVDTTAGAAREQLAKMRKEMENIARQVGANPADTGALEAAIRRMREALSESDDKVDQLYKEASALSSQLRRTREELEDVRTQLASAEALRKRIQIAEAEMEVTANQALQTRRAALIAEAELEQQLNQALQAQRQTLIAQVEGEQAENELLAVVRKATFQPKFLVLYHWTEEPNCANTSFDVRLIDMNGKSIPDGLNFQYLGGLGKALAERSDSLRQAFPLGTYVAGQPRHAGSVRTLWRSEQLRALTYAVIDKPATQACHIDLTTTIFDLELNVSRDLDQHDLEVPASTNEMLLNGIDIDLPGSSFRISAPTPLDQTIWDKMRAGPQWKGAPAQRSP
jgi:hypothetical protein